MKAGRYGRIALALVALGSLGTACRTLAGDPKAPTVTVSELARDLARGPASYKGQTVRVCRGRLSETEPPERREWQLAALDESFPHGAAVNVKACADSTPRLDSRGCLKGRIARLDGSLAGVAPGESVIVSSAIESFTWYLHAQCPGSG